MRLAAEPQTERTYEGFLALLRNDGFNVGIDECLRVEQLLRAVGPDLPLDQMVNLVCPLFATSEESQHRFETIFYTYFASGPPPSNKQPSVIKTNLGTESSETPSLDAPDIELEVKLKERRHWNWSAIRAAIVLLFLVGLYVSWPRTHTITITTTDGTSGGMTTSGGMITTTGGTATTTGGITTTTGGVSDVIPSKPGPPPPKPDIQPQFIDRYFWPLTIAFSALSAVLVGLIIGRIYRRPRTLSDRKTGEQPPFVWRLGIRAQAQLLFPPATIRAIALQLRHPLPAYTKRLNVPATVTASAKAPGLVSLRFTEDQRIPEYLVLIERSGLEDHQALINDALTSALRKESVSIVRYFFYGDPRFCAPEYGHLSKALSDLASRFPDRRLIVFSDIESLIDVRTARLAGWTEIFETWNNRAILLASSPEPSRYNTRLNKLFALGDASTDGLLQAAYAFHDTSESDSLTLNKALRIRRYGLGPIDSLNVEIPETPDDPSNANGKNDVIKDEEGWIQKLQWKTLEKSLGFQPFSSILCILAIVAIVLSLISLYDSVVFLFGIGLFIFVLAHYIARSKQPFQSSSLPNFNVKNDARKDTTTQTLWPKSDIKNHHASIIATLITLGISLSLLYYAFVADTSSTPAFFWTKGVAGILGVFFCIISVAGVRDAVTGYFIANWKLRPKSDIPEDPTSSKEEDAQAPLLKFVVQNVNRFSKFNVFLDSIITFVIGTMLLRYGITANGSHSNFSRMASIVSIILGPILCIIGNWLFMNTLRDTLNRNKKTLLKSEVPVTDQPSPKLEAMNDILSKQLDTFTGASISIFFGLILIYSAIMIFTSKGHNFAFVYLFGSYGLILCRNGSAFFIFSLIDRITRNKKPRQKFGLSQEPTNFVELKNPSDQDVNKESK